MRKRHWETWFVANAMAMVPFCTRLMTDRMVGHRVIIGTEATRELLFYALSASGIALVALNEASERGWARLCAFAALVLTIFSAIAYGEFLTGEALRAATNLVKAYYLSIGLATAALIDSAAAEALMHRRARQ